MPCRVTLLLASLLGTLILPARSATPSAPGAVTPREALAISGVGTHGRTAVHTDAIEAMLVAGIWKPPKAGDVVALRGGEKRAWSVVQAGADGSFTGRASASGYVYVPIEMPAERTMVLDAQGHNMVYVNGEPRAGGPYQTGYVRLPVHLRQGRNDLLFRAGGPGLKVRLTPPVAEAWIDTGDTTLPDVTRAGGLDWAAVVVVNAIERPRTDLAIQARGTGGSPVSTPVPVIGPLTVRKVGFRFSLPASLDGDSLPLQLELRDTTRGVTLNTARITLRIRKPGQTYKRAFISDIDGSVQYYAVNPASGPRYYSAERRRPALFLSLHGAGVEAIGQADAYEPKSWGDVVAPTNRRPYGFDWEDWGRLDALEVLRHAREELHSDPERIYLTGHSMGGHGTWSIGAAFPGQFAAIGPSAGWVSFESYAGVRRPANPTPVEAMLARAASPSDTLALERNFAQEGVYILHGCADDNVPVTEARTMRDHLALFHHDFRYHEQPGAGHWWDASDEPGTDCVDWAPMFDFFAHHALPADDQIRQVDFTTMSPGVSASCHWVTILAQEHPLERSTISIRFDPGRRRFVGTTANMERLRLGPGEAPVSVDLDGQKLTCHEVGPGNGDIAIERSRGRWTEDASLSAEVKNPARYGPFKEAFRNRMVFVYGTHGTPSENCETYARARFDAESFWYRGNGSVDVVPDSAFRPAANVPRNVILYGNADTNAAWSHVLKPSEVEVRRAYVRVGKHKFVGGNLGCLFVTPRRQEAEVNTEVGVVAGTGVAGLRLTEGLPYFLSGVGYPDCFVVGPEILTNGAAGVRAAGFFGIDWSVEHGDFAWGGGAPEKKVTAGGRSVAPTASRRL
jgi:dienelactone hydrolase